MGSLHSLPHVAKRENYRTKNKNKNRLVQAEIVYKVSLHTSYNKTVYGRKDMRNIGTISLEPGMKAHIICPFAL